MLLDFVATFPFDVFVPDMLLTRMIRLLRLTKLAAILDVGRIKRLVKAYYEDSTRADRHQSQYMVMFIFKIFRLCIIAFMITYFIGCFWWMLVDYINTTVDKKKGDTFAYRFAIDQYYMNSPDICKNSYCVEHIESGGKVNCINASWVEKNCHIDYGS